MSTFDRVKKIVVDQLGVNEADVTIDSTWALIPSILLN